MTDVLPPPYPEAGRGDLPTYSPTSTHGEIVLARQPVANRALPPNYQYKSRRLLLNLGRRSLATHIPAYGKNGIIQGEIVVKNFNYAEAVTLTASLYLRSFRN
jgi:hypothetical protein